MKIDFAAAVLAPVAALLFTGGVSAQTVPRTPAPVVAPAPASSLTRDLNSGPPAASASAPPVVRANPVVVPIPVATGPSSPAVRPPVAVPAAPVAAPAVAPVALPAPPAPTVTVLDATARAALPFRADLPPGFEIVTGRPGPDFKIYTIRRGERSFAMVYVGPASQFPIYSGQIVEAGGRASVVATEDGVRHAMEHLFQRPAAPREVHVWTMSLEGGDRALAEQIAQSVDVR